MAALLMAAWLASGCKNVGQPPPWWPKSWHPIAESRYCAPRAERPPSSGGHVREPADIQNVIRAHYAEFRRCYEELLDVNSNAEGKVLVGFVILPEGTVSDTCVDRETTLDNDVAVKCMLDVYTGIEFEPSTAPVTVVYPIMFSPGREPAPYHRVPWHPMDHR